MSRSGTSALTRVLSLCGATLPADLVGALPGNPRGSWEPRKAAYLNQAILQRHGSTPLDPTLRLQEDGAFDEKERAGWIAEIRAYLATLPAAPLVVIKDPRITVLSGLWFEAARQAGFDIATVVALRHPQEVVASVGVRTGATPELSGAVWLKNNLLAERDTRGVARVFVEYANLLENWRREMNRISAALAIDLGSRDEGAIEQFLTVDLRNQRHCGAVTELFGTDWISTVYEALRAAARDDRLDESALDRVFEAYRASEYDFRTVFTDLPRFQKFNWLVPPSMWKLIVEILARTHRRRGTWA